MSTQIGCTIDLVALAEFDMHYHELSDNLKQYCNLEIVNNPVWLQPFWKKEDYMTVGEKWEKGLPI